MTCPCLLQNADGSTVRVQVVAGVRTLTWTCGICGGFNSETGEYPPKRSADVLHRHGGSRGPASVSDMEPTVGPS